MTLQRLSVPSMCIAVVASCSLVHADVIVSETEFLQWSSLEESIIVDSSGNQLSSGYTFQLGAFVQGFTPDDTNVHLWAENWRVFDSAAYVPNESGLGEFSSIYTMYDNFYFNDHNGNLEFDLSISRDAYIWVYNNQDPVPGSEWFLARADTWVFPDLEIECCSVTTPIQWSMSDLGVLSPIWGSQLGNEGFGERDVFASNYDLQTFTFIPEPSSALLIAMGGLMGVMRRNRRPKAI